MSEIEPTSPPNRPGDGNAPAPESSRAPDAAGPEVVESGSVPLDEGRPLLELLKIAAPSVATMSSYTAMQFVDKLMVSRIGPEPIYVAAQSNAGVLCWTIMTFCVGVTGLVSSFVSQNLGAGKPERGSAYAWNSMYIAIGYWAAIMLPAVLVVPSIYGRLHGDTPDLLRLEVDYAQIVLAGAVFTLMSKGLHNYFFGLHRPGVVMVAVVVANLINIFASMVLVFGSSGFPLGDAPDNPLAAVWPVFGAVAQAAAGVAGLLGVEPMGMRGAAYGTVLANSLELAIPLLIFLGPKMASKFGTRSAWRLNASCVKDLFRVGWPAGLMFVNELICWSLLMIWLIPTGGEARAKAQGLGEAAIDQASLVANTTGWITLQWMHLAFMPTVGISIATQAMVGKMIGAGRTDLAAARTWLCVRVAMVYMGVCALCFLVFRTELTAVFINDNTDEQTAADLLRLGGWMLIGAAVFQVFDAVAIITSAALRGAGDTVWPGVMTIVLSWSLIIGVGFGLILVAPELGAMGPWIGASAYISVLGIALLLRFVGGRWKSRSLVQPEAGSGSVESEPGQDSPGGAV
ncbi:MAG: MATE family efflux transporter [Planctomycetota bacterium]